MFQELIWIGDVQVPIMVDEKDERWYPIAYLSEKVLLRKGDVISKGSKNIYVEYIRQFKINYDFCNGGINKANCISEIGLKKFIQNSHIGRLSINQRKALNILLVFLDLPLVTELELIIETLSEEELNKHDEYVKDIIKHMLISGNYKFQQCVKDERYYPLDVNFFALDNRTPTGYTKICHRCKGNNNGFKHPNEDINKAVRQAGENILKAFKEDKVIDIYKKYMIGDLKHLPDCYQNKDDYLRIVKWLFETDRLNIHKITRKELNTTFKLNKLYEHLQENDIYTYLFGEDYWKYPWRYRGLPLGKYETPFEKARIIFDEYIKEKEIDTSTNPFEVKYGEIAQEARIRLQDTLSFAVRYHDYKYPGYKFTSHGVNYYKLKENRIFDFKYFVEKEISIPIEKIPLYVTLTSFKRVTGTNTLYNALKKYYKSLYEWVDECYPNQFIEADFTVNVYRDEFDSIEESQIHDILKENFINVIYNQRNTERTINIGGMIPDWLIFEDSGCWLVEYFGMYLPKETHNIRNVKYMEKTDRKIEQYKNIKGYKKLYIYPEDLKNSFEGLYKKIRKIKG